MGKSNAERQAAYRARKRASGLVAVTVLVPAEMAVDFADLAQALQRYRSLELAGAPFRDRKTGRLVKLR